MVIKIEIENLDELNTICWCLEFAIKEDKIHPDNREQTKELVEKLRNLYENYKDIEKESAN